MPSLPAKPGEHPLHAIVSRLAPGHEAVLAALDEVEYPRGVDPGTSGGAPARGRCAAGRRHLGAGRAARSAVLALRAAGAARVSVLVAARWINEDFGGNAAFLRGLADRDYDPAICPWTGDGCPAP